MEDMEATKHSDLTSKSPKNAPLKKKKSKPHKSSPQQQTRLPPSKHHGNNAANPQSQNRKSNKPKVLPVEAHICRFIDYQPCAITATAVHPSNRYAAIGRENGNIEIWDLDGSFIQRVIPGEGTLNTVKSLMFINRNDDDDNDDDDDNSANVSLKNIRLISGGLHGWINEWDLESLSVKHKVYNQGYGVWDMCQTYIQPSKQRTNIDSSTISSGVMIGCACDDGQIRVYRLTADEFIFQSSFAASGRCLSVSWNGAILSSIANDSITNLASPTIYGGTSDGCIYAYDFIARKQISRIVVAPPPVAGVRKKAATKPMIWALAAIDSSSDAASPTNAEVACSTSRGSIDVYDAKFGTLIQSCNVAKNDIVSLQYVMHSQHNSARQRTITDMLIGACVDGRVLQLTRRSHENIQSTSNALLTDYSQKVTRQTEFVMTGYHRYHTHDVNTVAATREVVISGGIDTQLIVCSTRDFWTHHICSPLSHGYHNAGDGNTALLTMAGNCQWIEDVLPITAKGDSAAADSGEEDTKESQPSSTANREVRAAEKLSRKIILFQKDKTLELWHIYRSNNEVKPVKLMEVDCGFANNIICSAISRNGKWLTASDNESIKLWEIIHESQQLRLKKVLETSKRGTTTLVFSRASQFLMLTPTPQCGAVNESQIIKFDSSQSALSATNQPPTLSQSLDSNLDDNANIVILNLSRGADAIAIHTTVENEEIRGYLINSLSLNSDASLAAITIPTLNRAIVFHTHSAEIFYEIPRGINRCNVARLGFQTLRSSKKEECFVIYSDNQLKIFEYPILKHATDLLSVKESRRKIGLHQWCGNNAKVWSIYNRNSPFAFTNISFNPSTPNKPLLIRPEYMFSLLLNQELPLVYSGIGSKRTRGMMSGSDVSNTAKRRKKIEEMVPSPFGKPPGAVSAALAEANQSIADDSTAEQSTRNERRVKKQGSSGGYLRVVRKYDPMLMAEFIGKNSLLIVHCQWDQISAQFKRPVYRKRYGI